jgi:hypothetical protein
VRHTTHKMNTLAHDVHLTPDSRLSASVVRSGGLLSQPPTLNGQNNEDRTGTTVNAAIPFATRQKRHADVPEYRHQTFQETCFVVAFMGASLPPLITLTLIVEGC